jgi:hypothetical protein
MVGDPECSLSMNPPMRLHPITAARYFFILNASLLLATGEPGLASGCSLR